MKIQFQILLALFFYSSGIVSQEPFIKSIDYDRGDDTGYNVIEYNDRIFVNIATTCYNTYECCIIAEIDNQGNTIWERRVDWLDPTFSSMFAHDEKLVISGNRNRILDDRFWIFEMSMEGDSLRKILVKDESRPYVWMFNGSSTVYNDKYIIGGKGRLDDSIASLIYVVDFNGTVDTLIELERRPLPLDSRTNMLIEKDRFLYSFHKNERDANSFLEANDVSIYKFDEDFNMVWQYRSELLQDYTQSAYGLILEDDQLIVASQGSVQGNEFNVVSAVWSINPNGTKAWEHIFEDDLITYKSAIYNLSTTADGSILGVGYWGDRWNSPSFSNSAFMFKLDADGSLLWERLYYEIDDNTNQSRYSNLKGVQELSDGSIIAVGDITYYYPEQAEPPFYDNDLLIIKTDVNGCLDPYNCFKSNLATKVINIDFTNELSIFPNPADDYIQIQSPTRHLERVVIYDLEGKELMQSTLDQNEQIDISKLQSGVYLLQMHDAYGNVAVSKFVKV